MRIIIINLKKDFKSEQIQSMQEVGDVVFIEKEPDYNTKIFTDDKEKVIALGPEIIDWELSKRNLDKIKKLRAICIPTTSYSWLEGEYIRNKGVELTNVPKYSTESVAEYAISMMLNLAKKLPLVIKNDWKIDYDKHQGWEVADKTMGVVGLGSIGTRIAELGKAMGMKVTYWSKNSRDERFKYQKLEELLKKSDYIFPALAKNQDTENILDKKS